MAATIFDSFLVQIGLDATGFSRGSQKATGSFDKAKASAAKAGAGMEDAAGKAAAASEKAAKRIETAYGKADAALDRTVRNLLKLTALFTAGAGVAEFTSRITAADAAVGRLASSIGAAPADISAIANAIERGGGSADAATASFKRLADGIQEIKVRGDGALRQPLLEIQAAGGKNIDLAKNYVDVYADIADNLKAINDQRGAMAATFFGQQAGFDEGTINLLRQGGDAVRRAMAESKKLGGATKESADAAQAFSTALVTLKQISEDLGRTIVTAVSPTIVELLRQLREWVTANREVINSRINEFVEAFRALLKDIDWPTIIQGIRDFAKEANSAAQALGGWVNVTKILFGLWAGSKVLGIIATIARLRALLFGGGALFGGVLGLPLLGTAAVGAALAQGDANRSVNGTGGVPDRSMNPGDELPGVDSSENRRSRPGLWARARRAMAARSRGDRGGIGRAQQDANSAAVLDEFKRAGLPAEGVAALMGSAQTESRFNPRASNGVNGGHTGLLQWDSTRWPKIADWIKSQGGDPYDARWQARAAVAEGNAKPGDRLYDSRQTARGWEALRSSAGDLGKAMGGIRDIERYGPGEESGRGANARAWLPRVNGTAADPTGLRIAGAQATSGGDAMPGTVEAAKWAQANLGGFREVTALNDQFHHRKNPNSKHTEGLAADLAFDRQTTREVYRQNTEKLREHMRGMGMSDKDFYIKDEMNDPSANATGPHIHVQFNTPDAAAAYAAARRKATPKPEARIRGADPGPILASLRDFNRQPYMRGYGNMPGGYPLDTPQRMASAQAGRFSQTSSTIDRSSRSETNFNAPITVQTAATDASGIARDMEASLKGRSFAIQSNTGVA